MLKRKIADLAEALLKPINPSLIVILGVYTIIWGLWLINPFWSVLASASLYSVMGEVCAEWLWGAFAIAMGGVTVYGALKPSYSTLTRGAQAVTWHWGIIALFYFMGDWMNTGGITALMLCTYAALVYLNVKINYGRNPNVDNEGRYKNGIN